MKLKLGELCAGYGGLGLAVEDVFNADAVWFSELDNAPSKILAHHWPHVPNYGDMTQIDWATIEPVDIISGGTPCQDLSAAGRRAGMTEGTRSNLWVQMREAIAIQRPRYVVWENVRGAYSAEASSDLELCPGCMGDARDGRTVLRALGRVLGDLSDLGYDTQWRGLRASDVGACHGRFRVFVLAAHRDRLRYERPGDSRGWWTRSADGSFAIANTKGGGRRLCKPNDERPTGRTIDSPGHDSSTAVRKVGSQTNWGDYESSVQRWEQVVGRRAPSPTEPTGRGSGHRLSPHFTEWMMGLPQGWVTDPAIGITSREQVKACGNGVVPQQAVAALADMLAAFQSQRVAA